MNIKENWEDEDFEIINIFSNSDNKSVDIGNSEQNINWIGRI